MARPDPDTIFGDPAFDTACYSTWMTMNFTKLERCAWELKSQSPNDELDVLVFDLRLARGASIDSLDVDEVIDGATMFSRKRPRALVAACRRRRSSAGGSTPGRRRASTAASRSRTCGASRSTPS